MHDCSFMNWTQAGAEHAEVLLQAVQHVCIEELDSGDSKLRFSQMFSTKSRNRTKVKIYQNDTMLQSLCKKMFPICFYAWHSAWEYFLGWETSDLAEHWGSCSIDADWNSWSFWIRGR